MKTNPSFWVIFAALLSANFALASDPKPKYGPEATVLSKSHEYFRHAAAPDFWNMMPFYTAQQDDSSCSVASVAMLVNAAREALQTKLTADDELATQESLVKKVQHPAWHKLGFATSLDELGEISKQALEAYGVKPISIEVVHAEDTPAAATKLHAALVENEKSARDIILINFDQKVYTGDEQVGHIAPIGAYDSKAKRVLVMDPDRKWYEPYWVSETTLLKGLATRDSGKAKNRGYVYIKF